MLVQSRARPPQIAEEGGEEALGEVTLSDSDSDGSRDAGGDDGDDDGSDSDLGTEVNSLLGSVEDVRPPRP